MSSDSSDEENLELLREATDTHFINDDMFKNGSDEVEEKIKTKHLPSLRRSKDEDEQFNLFRVTPEFRNHVAKHLSKLLEENLIKRFKFKESPEKPDKKRRKGGVKLLRTSKQFLKVSKESHGVNSTPISTNKVDRYKKLRVEVDDELLKNVAVTPEDILNKTETRHWSNRSKAPVFKYKKSKTGQLFYVKPEFK